MKSTPLVSAGVGVPPRWLSYALSFWGGFQIMVLEICGMRLLQTNVGSSVVVTGALLTLVMISLSVGYALGGVTSARVRSPARLFMWLLIAVAYTQLSTSFLLEPVLSWGAALRNGLPADGELRVILPAAVVTAALYGVPMLLLSMISPYLVRFFSAASGDGRASAGYGSGFFMSLSTLGSIAGTLLASYVFVPRAGVELTTLATNAVMFVLAGSCWLWSQPGAAPATSRSRWVMLLALAAVLVGFAVPKPGPKPGVVYEAESAYGSIQIVERQDAAGRNMLVYHPSRFFTHSLLYPSEPLRDLPELMYLAPTRFTPPRDILVLGSAAGGILRRIEVAFPEARVVGVDVDPQVHEVARDVFRVNLEQSQLVTADARTFLQREQRRYDFIIIDLFAGEFIPSHCITVEFFKLVRERLNERGSVFLNTNMQDIHHELPEGSEPFRAVRHLQSTLRAAGFPSLLENSFFHSMFVFPFELSVGEFRRDLLAAFGDGRHPASLRAGAGLAAFTTAEVPKHARQYRPFSDEWLPTLLIEQRTNAAAIYGQLEHGQLEHTPREPGAAGRTGALPALSESVLRARWTERSRSGKVTLRDAGLLMASLDALTAPLDAASVDLAAAYLRYPYYKEMLPSDRSPASPWSNLAALYARMYTLGYRNEYEQLLPVLETIGRELGLPG